MTGRDNVQIIHLLYMSTNTTDFYGAMGEQEFPSVWGEQLKNLKL